MNKQELINHIKDQNEWSGNHRFILIKKEELISMIEDLDQPQKVKVPAAIGKHIKKRKADGDNFHESILATNSQIYEWYMENAELYEQAWFNGYEVEEEPKRMNV